MNELVSRAEELLTEVHRSRGDLNGRDLGFRSWTPHGKRKRRQRLFIASSIDGVDSLVVKVPVDDDDVMVAHEWKILSKLQFARVKRPVPVRAAERGFVMSYVPAMDLADMLSPRPESWPELLCDSLATAARLHKAPANRLPSSAASVASTYVPDQSSLTANTLSALRRASSGPTHGDLGVWNIRIGDDGTMSLIDWEDYRQCGVPALDALNILLTSALVLYPEYPTRGFDWLYEQVFVNDGPFRQAMSKALGAYCKITGDAPGVVMRLTPFFCRWMIRRISLQGRPTDGMFYATFAERFEAEPPPWLREPA
ncbi:hypothetical protein [Catellatospora methionotrophica]|uniref:hypothetical protein n=1 Tax=Catellatospora methionotrophica TaxID=121620 RepID=UPI0033FE233A